MSLSCRGRRRKAGVQGSGGTILAWGEGIHDVPRAFTAPPPAQNRAPCIPDEQSSPSFDWPISTTYNGIYLAASLYLCLVTL